MKEHNKIKICIYTYTHTHTPGVLMLTAALKRHVRNTLATH